VADENAADSAFTPWIPGSDSVEGFSVANPSAV
jgi:hypothetical protein